MGLDQFWIDFDNQSRSFWPGQEVSGRVVVVCDSAKRIEGLKIKVEGKASVRWEETETRTVSGHNNQSRTETITHVYEDSDTLLKYKFYALGDGRTSVTVPAGRSEFPFRYILPLGLPSSFVGTHGKVVYMVKGEMVRSWKLNKDTKSQFTVNALLDLNLDPVATTPGERRDAKNLCCFCCASGPISYVLRTPRQGFVPGEYVQFEVEMLNNTSRNVTGATLSLVQTVSFYARGRSKAESKTFVKIRRDGVEPGDSEVWRGNVLQIPSVPPTKLGNCRIIDVQYKLHFEMNISGPAINLKGTLPILIGTVPLRNTFSNFVAQPSGNDFAPSAPSIAYPDLPPPSYEDAIREDVPPGEANDYVPKYVIYGWKN